MHVLALSRRKIRGWTAHPAPGGVRANRPEPPALGRRFRSRHLPYGLWTQPVEQRRQQKTCPQARSAPSSRTTAAPAPRPDGARTLWVSLERALRLDGHLPVCYGQSECRGGRCPVRARGQRGPAQAWQWPKHAGTMAGRGDHASLDQARPASGGHLTNRSALPQAMTARFTVRGPVPSEASCQAGSPCCDHHHWCRRR